MNQAAPKPVSAPTEAAGDDEAHRFGRPPENLPSYQPAPPTRRTKSQVEIRALDLNRRKDRAAFIDMAPPLYEADPHYIAPLRHNMMHFLRPAQNPALRNLDIESFVAVQDGRTLGRITAHIDRAFDAYHETKAGFFGFFECVPSQEIAHALLGTALASLERRGAKEVFGPLNFTTNHQSGLLIENFDRPAFIENNYNPPYYQDLIESFGFGKAKDLLAWWIDVGQGLDNPKVARVAKVAERIRKREGITVRGLNMRDLDGEIERVFSLYNRSWEKNWGFVPLDREEFSTIARELRSIVIPSLVIFVEVKGEPVGFSCTLPNINEVMPRNGRLLPFAWWRLWRGMKRTQHGRLYTLGVVPEYRKRGLEALMFVETVKRGKAAGFSGGEIGWTLEDNDLINRAIESMDGYIDRRYRIFGMKL